MLTLLHNIQKISSCKDRMEITRHFITGIFDYYNAANVELFKVIDGKEQEALKIAQIDGNSILLFASEIEEERISSDIIKFASQEKPVFHYPCHDCNMQCYVVSNLHTNISHEKLILLLHSPKVISSEDQDALNYFFGYFINYMALLDYSECDSLTGLLNRKTFDDTFEQILNSQTKQSVSKNVVNHRNEDSANANSYWLAEIDIDKFKRINDTFGHLFGDEVLIRVANLMRQSLRSYDKLFRFGGEEFIIIFKIADRSKASHILNRLIKLIENSDFPQVGKVTCSIGFTKIDSLIPVDILGKADKALYYAKENGRNQVRCYEELVELGLLEESKMPLNNQEDVDIFFQ